MARAFLGLGANLGDERELIAAAIAALGQTEGVRVLARSRDYRTPPWGDTAQRDFVNACVMVDTRLTPEALLARALAVEAELGRDRGADARRWGPRRIDIDILAYEGVRRHEAPILPHPRLRERAFALVPLAEIAPEADVGGLSAAEALARIEAGAIMPLD